MTTKYRNMSKYEDLKRRISRMIWKCGIITQHFDAPYAFPSGLRSPICCDFRECLGYPDLMAAIEEALSYTIPNDANHVIAGVAPGALPHAACVARRMELPLCYVQPGAGTERIVEGAAVKGKFVYLINDDVITGSSLLNDADALLRAGAAGIEALSILSYDTKQSRRAFKAAKIRPSSVLTFGDLFYLFDEHLAPAQAGAVRTWAKDPEAWTKKYLASHPQ